MCWGWGSREEKSLKIFPKCGCDIKINYTLNLQHGERNKKKSSQKCLRLNKYFFSSFLNHVLLLIYIYVRLKHFGYGCTSHTTRTYTRYIEDRGISIYIVTPSIIIPHRVLKVNS